MVLIWIDFEPQYAAPRTRCKKLSWHHSKSRVPDLLEFDERRNKMETPATHSVLPIYSTSRSNSLATVKRLIENNDANGDRTLNAEELGVPQEVFTIIDRNGDGQADRIELCFSYPEVKLSHEITSLINNNDSDGDGVLSAEELQVPDEAFAHIDSNSDGQADANEVCDCYRKARVNHAAAQLINNEDTDGDRLLSAEEIRAPLEEDFARVDANGDGQVCRTEFITAYRHVYLRQEATKVIENNDTDGDGVLSAEELGVPEEVFEALDTNGDGQADKTEFIDNYREAYLEHLSTRLIENNDADGDGVLSRDELGASQNILFVETQTNGDELLDREELQAFIREIYA